MSAPKSSLGPLTLGAIGVVYGDIGTSVLYAVKEVFSSGHLEPTTANVYGVMSMFFWTLTLIVTLKYVTLVMRADNHGEGGLVALLALAMEAVSNRPRLRNFLLLLGVFGAGLFYGDGVITPAISVLSAVEGLEIVSPTFTKAVIPLTLLVLLALFAVQKHGTAGIGRLFGPIMVVWFVVIGAAGAVQVLERPEILWAISPHHALGFMWRNPGLTFVLLGAVVLCVTGGEALYADMGHFGRKPIRLAWFGLAMPALALNYLGQGALLLARPEAVENPFFLMTPQWGMLPMVGLATAATVIASQALISGAYSVTKQVIQLGYLPRLQIQHTSAEESGQIYLPFVNWSLFVCIVLAVGMFKTSSNLAAAYGIAVTLVMLITTVLTFFVVRYRWGYPLWLSLGATSFFVVIDLAFFGSNLLKLTEGGWFPLAIGAVVFLLMTTWHEGRRLLGESISNHALDLGNFLESIFASPPVRADGTAVFLSAQPDTVPNALLHNLKHNKVLHEQNLFVTVRNHGVPWIEPAQRLETEALGRGCWKVIVNLGFMDDTDLPRALAQLERRGVALDPMRTSYFLSRDIIVPSMGGRMAQWREKLFAQMHHNASSAAEFLKLPNNAVVELGSKIEI